MKNHEYKLFYLMYIYYSARGEGIVVWYHKPQTVLQIYA